MEVPENMAYPLSANEFDGEVAANMFTPGAVISGCKTHKQTTNLKTRLYKY